MSKAKPSSDAVEELLTALLAGGMDPEAAEALITRYADFLLGQMTEVVYGKLRIGKPHER
jgi:hypothetical protein